MSLNEFQQRVMLSGVVPKRDSLNTHVGRFVICLEGIPAGEMGRAAVSGVSAVLLYVNDPEHEYADIHDGSIVGLQTCPFGAAQILWKQFPGALGQMWAVVRISNETKQVYRLEDCEKKKPALFVLNEFRDYVGRVVKVAGVCYEVFPARCSDPIDPSNPPVVVRLDEPPFDDCDECRSCYELINCVDSMDKLYTNSNLSASVGGVVKLDDDVCYQVFEASNCIDASPVSVTESYDDCTACDKCYTLVNCWDSMDSIEVKNDLATLSGKTDAQLISESYVFVIDGKCYFVDSYDTCTGAAVSVTVDAQHDNCADCGCWRLIDCENSANIIYAHSAEDTVGAALKLSTLTDQIVRLDDGKCYSVEAWQDCATSVEVTIQEAYDSCADCDDVWHLIDCEDSENTLDTYTDLSFYGIGTIVKRASDGTCWAIDSKVSWSAGAVDFGDVEDSHPACGQCDGTEQYLLSHACEPEECTGNESMPDIITNEDLHESLGKYVKVEGHCYSVAADESSTVTHEAPLAFTGPFDACEDCVSSPVDGARRRITRIYCDSDQSEYAEVEEEVYRDGQLVGVCKQPDEPLCAGEHPGGKAVGHCFNFDYTMFDVADTSHSVSTGIVVADCGWAITWHVCTTDGFQGSASYHLDIGHDQSPAALDPSIAEIANDFEEIPSTSKFFFNDTGGARTLELTMNSSGGDLDTLTQGEAQFCVLVWNP